MVSLLLRRMFPAESFNAASVTSRQQTAQPNRHKNENSTLTRTNPLIGARHFQFMVQTEFWLKLTHLCDPRLLWKSLRPRMELTKGTLRPCPSPPSPCPGPYSLGRYQEDELRQISLYVKVATDTKILDLQTTYRYKLAGLCGSLRYKNTKALRRKDKFCISEPDKDPNWLGFFGLPRDTSSKS